MKTELPVLPRGLSWKKHRSGNVNIQIAFTYQGVRCRESLSNLGVKKSDINYAINLLGEIKAKIERQQFKYADYFPNSPKLEVFGEAKQNATLIEYLDEYLKACETKGFSFTTLDRYKGTIRRMAELHNIPIVDIDQSVLKQYFMKQKTNLQTCKKALYIISGAMKEAITDNVISSNPCVGFTLANYVSSKQRVYNTCHEVDPFLPLECRTLINTAFEIDPQHGCLVQLWLNTGLRTGEIVGLRWEDIDFANRTITIQRNMINGIIKETKTKSSVRKFRLDDEAFDALVFQKQFTYFKQEFVFMNGDEPLNDSTAIRDGIWRKLIKISNVRYRRPYQCRHTYATRKLSQDANVWSIAQSMGHKSPSMLEKHYGAFIDEFAQDREPVGLSLDEMNQYIDACHKRVVGSSVSVIQ